MKRSAVSLPPVTDPQARSFALATHWQTVGSLRLARDPSCDQFAEAVLAAMTDDELCSILRGREAELDLFVRAKPAATVAEIARVRRALRWIARLAGCELLRRNHSFATVEP